MTRSTRAVRGSVLIAILIVVLDQLTKAWALSVLDDRDIDLFWTLRFHLTRNSGMAFSRGEGLGPVIGVLALVVVAALLVSPATNTSPASTVAVGLVIGGAAGMSSIGCSGHRVGCAVPWIDFIDLQWWPIFTSPTWRSRSVVCAVGVRQRCRVRGRCRRNDHTEMISR